MINFNISIELYSGEILNLTIPGINFLDAILTFYKIYRNATDSQPIKSFTLIHE